MHDPIFDDVPWEFVTDENGNEIGAVYLLPHDPPPRRRQKQRREIAAPLNRTYILNLEGYSNELD
ncbi:hypothetical protein M5X00_17405 [Paenibacillus alvei]|uniref:Uncharacterized protein n=1 Tax=Paenibacillus alvei TaxID=44250 RepID=A0ABT4GZS6_PAEAL|nr:hypothetical protein [Paenibacillus alvei]EJW19166.1 hypothetical protein PAV_1c01370 [Paenibacillus alvei DSM 29]MCY9544243.1 hypothetical protein [Paenibacillus alvei]MCY9706331.1 hypothetical protein [Paenibacillus alvei]MCY9732233.1 hypothetical protein [Paenibacillus alvei]MCY9756017.1 hypothetical protein [Paenibacillus alvei]